jgi:hypothetical protein
MASSERYRVRFGNIALGARSASMLHGIPNNRFAISQA